MVNSDVRTILLSRLLICCENEVTLVKTSLFTTVIKTTYPNNVSTSR